jgi:hypothetical protein
LSRPQTPWGINVLQSIFNLRANTPGKLLLPDVHGTMDVSQQWPLPYNLTPLDYTAVAGTNTKVIAAPKAGFHQLVVHAYYTMSVPAATKRSALFLTNTKATGPTANITLQSVDMVTLSQVPLVNAGYFQDGTVVYIKGLHTVYVPFPFTLSHSLTHAAGAEVCTLRVITLQLPDSQPFTSLLGLT